MTEPFRQPRPRLDAWIKIAAGIAGAPFVVAGVLAGFDRSGGS